MMRASYKTSTHLRIMQQPSGEIRPFRTLLLGSVFSSIVALFGPYNNLVLVGSYLTIDFTTAAAVFLLFVFALFVNGAFRRFFPPLAFSSGELYVGYVMAAIACSICTMGLTLYLVPILPAFTYFASAENQWGLLIPPLMPQWLIPQGEEVIRYFYEGIPADTPIPWMAWVQPLLAWLPVLFGLYLMMISLAMLFRTQWIEHERLPYPLAQLPLTMGAQEPGRALNAFFRNPFTWCGFAIPFSITSFNGLHTYFEFFPEISLSGSMPIFDGAESLTWTLSFPMTGFAYLINQEISFSIWVFYLLGLVAKGGLAVVGLSRDVTTDLYAQSDGGSIISFVQFGALSALVAYTLWVARDSLRKHLGRAMRPEPGSGTSGSEISSRLVLLQLVAGGAMMIGWFIAIGVPW